MPSPKQVVRDLEWLANETALAHRFVKETYPKRVHAQTLDFLERTYVHDQRRIWEKEQTKS